MNMVLKALAGARERLRGERRPERGLPNEGVLCQNFYKASQNLNGTSGTLCFTSKTIVGSLLSDQVSLSSLLFLGRTS